MTIFPGVSVLNTGPTTTTTCAHLQYRAGRAVSLTATLLSRGLAVQVITPTSVSPSIIIENVLTFQKHYEHSVN